MTVRLEERRGSAIYRPETIVVLCFPPPPPWWRRALDDMAAEFWPFMAHVVGPVLPILGAAVGVAVARQFF